MRKTLQASVATSTFKAVGTSGVTNNTSHGVSVKAYATLQVGGALTPPIVAPKRSIAKGAWAEFDVSATDASAVTKVLVDGAEVVVFRLGQGKRPKEAQAQLVNTMEYGRFHAFSLTRGIGVTPKRNFDYLMRMRCKQARLVITSRGRKPVVDGGGDLLFVRR
jgi:hypothetical protein